MNDRILRSTALAVLLGLPLGGAALAQTHHHDSGHAASATSDSSARNVFLVLLATLFLVGVGVYAVRHTPVDALPDLSDVQVIVYTDHAGQTPQVVEDQVTYPLSTAMLAVPRAKVVRGFSMFGASYVYVIFEDGTDIYWPARACSST